jgi:hypothetical protein
MESSAPNETIREKMNEMRQQEIFWREKMHFSETGRQGDQGPML